MKKLLSLALSLVMVFTLSACGSGNTEDSGAASRLIKIGVFEPASGDSASGGRKETLGMEFANTETPTVEIGGEIYNVQLVRADNGSKTSKAPSAAADLIAQNVVMVLGSYGSGVSMAASDVFQEAGIAALGVSCTSPGVTAGNDHYFRICFLDSFQAEVLANFAVDKFSAKTAYCLGESGNEYDQGLIAFFTESFEANGGKVIAGSFPSDCSDFNAYIMFFSCNFTNYL